MRITQAEYDEIVRRQAIKLANRVPILTKRERDRLDMEKSTGLPILAATSVYTFLPGIKAAIQPSTNEAKLNKTERAYLAYLRFENHPFIGIQNITLKLADDTRYTPDFILITSDTKLQAHEVKGFWRDDAKVKIKVAARQFPFVEFIVVMKSKSGWTFESVKP